MRANTIGERHHGYGKIGEGEESGAALDYGITHHEKQALMIKVISSNERIERK